MVDVTSITNAGTDLIPTLSASFFQYGFRSVTKMDDFWLLIFLSIKILKQQNLFQHHVKIGLPSMSKKTAFVIFYPAP